MYQAKWEQQEQKAEHETLLLRSTKLLGSVESRAQARDFEVMFLNVFIL